MENHGDSFLQQLNTNEKQILDVCLDKCENNISTPSKKRRSEKYKCHICEKVIVRKDNYDRHINNHREKSFPCTICGKCFTRKYGLIQHVKNSHQKNKTTEHSKPQQVISPPVAVTHQSGGNQTNIPTHRSSDISSLNGVANMKTFYPNDGDSLDILVFFANIKDDVKKHLQNQSIQLANYKWYACVQIELEKIDKEGGKQSAWPHFRSKSYIHMKDEDTPEYDLNEAFQKMFTSFEKYLQEGSNWTLKKVLKLQISTASYKPLGGSTYRYLSP